MFCVAARGVTAGLIAYACFPGALVGSAAAATIPDNLSDSLSYRVVGTITPSCSLSQPVRDVAVVGLQDDATDTVRATDTDLPFSIACTAPVRVTMASANGGLKTDRLSSDGDFATLVAYGATLDLPGNSAALACRSGEMTNGGAQCSDDIQDGAFDGDGRIRIHTNASGELLLAGTYTDTVTLTISPQLDGDSQSAGQD